MGETACEHYEMNNKPNEYLVTFGFHSKDISNTGNMFGDKNKEQDIDKLQVTVEVMSGDLVSAIIQAQRVVMTERAITMMGYMDGIPDFAKQDSYTIDDLNYILEKMKGTGVFESWMMLEPTSIQVARTDNVSMLQDMTVEAITNDIADTADKAEAWLKEQDKQKG